MKEPVIDIRLAISVLPPISEPPFHQWLQPDGSVWADFHFSSSNYLLRFPGMADFRINESGQQITATPHTSLGDATLQHLLYNQALPLALSRQGLLVLHGSAVMIGGKAVAFLGKSGMGKSSLAASFAASGFPFLTDDALVLAESPVPRILPGRPAIRLWQDSVEELIRGNPSLLAALDYTDKMCILADNEIPHHKDPIPFAAIFCLADDGAETVTSGELQGNEAVLKLLGNTMLLDINQSAVLEKNFNQLCALATAVPICTLDYPRDYAFLPRVREHIVALVTDSQWPVSGK
jgi:hypothetical protein